MKIHGRSVAIERICRVGVCEELGKERLENVGEIIESCPGLVDNVKTDCAGHFINVGMIYLQQRQRALENSS